MLIEDQLLDTHCDICGTETLMGKQDKGKGQADQ
jgi:hypothetical protein